MKKQVQEKQAPPAALKVVNPLHTDALAFQLKMDLPPALQQYKQKGLMASQQLQALGHRCGDNHVLVMRRPPRDSFGTIILPDIAQEKSSEGVVVAVGRGHLLPGGEYRPLFVKPGDYVTFSKYYGTETELGGVMFLQLLECEIENAL